MEEKKVQKNVRTRRVQLINDTFYVNLPKGFVSQLGINPGDEMVVILDGGEVRMTPARRNHASG